MYRFATNFGHCIIEVLKQLFIFVVSLLYSIIIITQLYENVSDVIDDPQNRHHRFYDNVGDELGVSADNVSLASIINQALSSLSTAAAASTTAIAHNATVHDIPQIPAYIRTTSMVFCITIMLLGVIGNLMVSTTIQLLLSLFINYYSILWDRSSGFWCSLFPCFIFYCILIFF